MSRPGWRFPELPLRSHLLLLVLGAALPLAVFGAVLVATAVRANRTEAQRRLLESARAQAATIDRQLGGTVRTLKAIAESSSMDRQTPSAFRDEALNIVRTQPAWFALLVIRSDGRVALHTARPAGSSSQVADPESFDRLLRTGRPVVGNLRLGSADHLAFPVRVPVLRGGRLRWVLTALITPEALAGIVEALSPTSEEWTRTIVDGNGVIVARTRNPEAFVGRQVTASFFERTRNMAEGVYRDRTMEGAPVAVAFSRAPVTGWTSAIALPVGVLDAPLRRSLALTGAFAALLGISAIAAYWLAGRLASAITSTTRAAEALASGEPLPLEPSSVTEVTRLRQALQRSAELIAAHGREREEHVRRAEGARSEAETANRTKDAFLAMLGHELRNPLAPIVTALALLKQRRVAWTREHDVIDRQVQHLTRLVSDLLDVSRIARGKIELRRELVTLDAVVHRAAEMTAPLFEQRKHRLEVDVPSGVVVSGDQVRLAQVFANLLSNAAAYTPPAGRIRLSATIERNEVAVSVSDNGQGIAPELLPRVFDLFVQGQRTIDRRDGGLGLGLAIARSLTALHGGRIEAASDGVGRGSTFTVRLPVAENAVVAPPAPPAFVGSVRPLRVLVVDDNADAAEMLQHLLAAGGHEARTACDGPTALDLADRFRPEVMVLDIGLPAMDGYEVAERVQARLGARAPVLIAVSGYGQDEDLERSRTCRLRPSLRQAGGRRPAPGVHRPRRRGARLSPFGLRRRSPRAASGALTDRRPPGCRTAPRTGRVPPPGPRACRLPRRVRRRRPQSDPPSGRC